MAAKIKCSYDDCFKHFSTLEAMKKHKAKGFTHDFYCKKCDMDCNDDMELLYHQITSLKHMACPICGKDFKSESGRDRHVEIEHVPRQNITCMGCQLKFDRASALMAHIERDECETIRLEHFQRQRAEKQIVEEAWTAALDPTAGATVLSNARSYVTAGNEMNLLDDERAFVNTDWQGRPQYDEENEHNGPYVDPPTEQMSNLSVDRFPPLGVQNRAQPDRYPLITDEALDSADLQSEQKTVRPAAMGVWASEQNGAAHLFEKPLADRQVPTPENRTSVNLLDTFTEDDFIDHNDAFSHYTNKTPNSSLRPEPSTIPPASRAENLDPNHPYAQIKLQTRPDPPNRLLLGQFWDPVLSKYICPSQRCGGHFSSPQAFTDHLTRPPHVGGKVACPGCYKKFNTTTALIAHCESGSRRCRVRDSTDFDRVIQQATAGLMAVDGLTEEGAVKYTAQPVEKW